MFHTHKLLLSTQRKLKVLVIVCSHEFHAADSLRTKAFIESLRSSPQITHLDVCAIGSSDDFALSFRRAESDREYLYDIEFAYKIIDPSRQMTKLTSFLSDSRYQAQFESYDWFVKTRPDIEVHQCIDFSTLQRATIYARAREYVGPQSVPFGTSIDRKSVPRYFFAGFRKHPTEQRLVLDDQLLVFDAEIWRSGAMQAVADTGERQDEWFHTRVWKQRGANMGILGLQITFLRDGYQSDCI